MRIGLNAQRLEGQRLGVGRYLEYLVTNWSRQLAGSETVDVFLRAPLEDSRRVQLRLTDRVRPRVLRPRLTGITWENLVLGPAARNVDLLFGPSYTLPVTHRGPCVVATHSVNEAQPGSHPWWYRYTYTALYRSSARRADAVIVPSESTKRDVERIYGIPSARVVVVHQGADDAFRPLHDAATLRRTRERFFGGDRPYVLFVGKCSQRRNIPTLLRAFAEVKRRRRLPHGLVLFGPNHLGLPLPELCQTLGIADSVVQTNGDVPDHRDLVPVYNAAEVFVHPSSYEGWSMTTMEALACGTPVIAVNRGGLGEVAAGHAYMVDDPSVEGLADALDAVLTDSALRQDLHVKARARGAAFRWEDTTRHTLDVLRRVAA